MALRRMQENGWERSSERVLETYDVLMRIESP